MFKIRFKICHVLSAVLLMLYFDRIFANSNIGYKRSAEPNLGGGGGDVTSRQPKLAEQVLTHYLQRRLSLKRNQSSAPPAAQLFHPNGYYAGKTHTGATAANGNFEPVVQEIIGDFDNNKNKERLQFLDDNNYLPEDDHPTANEEQGECNNCGEDTPVLNRWMMPLLRSGDKKYYLGTFFKANWYRAAQYCRYHGMHLASISNQEENDKLEKYVTEFGLGHEHFWTSGTDLAEEGTFFWLSNGKPIVYTNWNAGEPNNFRYENGEEEHCLELWNRDGKGLKWNDSPCSFETYFICEL